MRMPPVDRDDEALGLADPSVTRRDFVGGDRLGPDGTGPGGIDAGTFDLVVVGGGFAGLSRG